MRTSALLIPALSVLLALGCKKESSDPVETETPIASAPDQEETKPATSTRQDKPVSEAKAPKPSKPTVTLLEAGAEPRRELRYTPKVGLQQTLTTTIKMQVQTKLKGAPGPTTKMPPMIMTMKLVVTKAGADSFDYDFEIVKAETGSAEGVPKVMADAVAKELAKTAGLKGHATVDSRGFTSDASVDVPDGMPQRMKQLIDGMQQSFEQMSAPFPAEPVGKGAKWRVDQTLVQTGMTMQQSSTFELVALTDDSVELAISLKQEAGPQQLKAPGVPSTAKLNKLVGKGKGKSKLLFAKIAPQESEIEVSNDTSIQVMVGNAAQNMETNTKMQMTLTGK